MPSSLLRAALVLGLLSAVGPFAIDMYLPALPRIGADLGASVPAMQGTITSYFIAFGLAQLIYGPWADQAGRKTPIYVGLGIFLLGTLICTFAPTTEALIFGRFVQGLGGAAVMVVPRAVIRDLSTGHEATRMMAAIMLVISVSPFLAPLVGAGLMALAGWRAIFGALILATVISLLMTRFLLQETLAPTDRQPVSVRALLRGSAKLLTHRGFMALTLLGGFAMGSFFVFIASASFVYAEAFGLTPTQFSLAFAVNALGFFSSSQVAARLGMRFGARTVMVRATMGFAVFTIGLFGIGLMGGATLVVTMAGLFLANACLGLVIPTAMVMALDDHGDVAGLASSLGGTLQMLAGGVMIALTGPFFDGSVLPMLAAIALCGALALMLAGVVARLPAAPKVQASA
ncbi:Bcr/CflA family drug resistance efflux transporter [Gemmobacter lanyuensis]|uniref:Bcr/CflA family efflux transporter n=1 Tax=Gemmobacter lanyuensis TaxID=1054497 RepID=A0A918MFL9_9RHOB|nr:multidrug effflux MFS transporter [Gemmobacter lanyuensis]GGW21544.1 Bcr/CflA family drug resistance efflux transporter [Gemmobacter lanyuensis]